MKKNTIIALACLLALSPTCIYAGPVVENEDPPAARVVSEDIELRSAYIFSGNVNNQAYFSKQAWLKPEEGSYVNYWIKNTGGSPITININNQIYRTFSPGEQGHISANVTIKQMYYFNAYPTYGGMLNMQCAIRQRK
ncbi:hypothetical protein ACKQTC_03875 [Peptococcus simiae]|uniref:DUF5626 domain-containing protein n=1 Tax=Peptococcus simiae TaxID=1643805 RepID=A0ABW9GXZ8_9FIRM